MVPLIRGDTMTDLVLLRELRGHSGDVNYCSWSPSDQTLCSCSGDKTVRVWDVKEGKEIRSPLLAHSYYINACVHSPAGDLLATASSDNSVKLWSTSSWNVVGTLTGHCGAVRHCCFSQDGNLIATASADSTVMVWEVGPCRCISTLTRHSTDSSVTCCGFAPNGWLLVTGGSTGDVILFDAFTKQTLARVSAHDLGVNALHVVLREETVTVATAGHDNSVKVWKVTISGKKVSIKLQNELLGHSSPVYSCCFSPDVKMLASGSADKTVVLWDMATMTLIYRVEAHPRYVIHCSFSPDGRYLTSASNDKCIKIWTVTNKDTLEKAEDEASQVPDKPQQTATTPSLISAEGWSLEDVCKWVEAIGSLQNSGQPTHSDDMRAVERLSRVMEGVYLDTDGVHKGPGDNFKCPITTELIRDPVVAADGHTYERSAIMEWLSKGRRTSPVTNLPLSSTLLLPNRHFRTIANQQAT